MANDINAVPSYNPADLETQSGTMNYILRCNNMNNSVCIPAIVESYDRKKHIVTVKPAITITATTGETLERESITATVMSVCGNKFIMNFPLEKGDTGWLITADRDISLFREQRKVINANTNRIHSIEDSFFIPDRVNDFKIDDEDKDNFVLQSLSRNLKITFSKDTIKIYAGPEKDDGKKDEKKSPETNKDEEKHETFITLKKEEISIITTDDLISESKNAKVTVKETLDAKAKNANITTEENLTATVKKDCSVKADGNINIKAPNINIEGEVSIKGNVSISGNESVSGNVDVSGNVTASDCIGGGKSLAGHIHQGVHGPTGGPQ